MSKILTEFKYSNLLGLSGPNGCGKTTLLKRLKLELGDTSVYMDQLSLETSRFIYLSSLLESFFEEDHEIYLELKRLGLNEKLTVNFNDLSGGEKQLIKILISCFLSTDLIFLDEPSSFLDIQKIKLITDFIKSQSKNRKFLIVDHDRSFLDNCCTKIILFKEFGLD